jgi:hypothetical protein
MRGPFVAWLSSQGPPCCPPYAQQSQSSWFRVPLAIQVFLRKGSPVSACARACMHAWDEWGEVECLFVAAEDRIARACLCARARAGAGAGGFLGLWALLCVRARACVGVGQEDIRWQAYGPSYQVEQ